ncbi:hypothetical protein [Botrimarina hoheduenensis]|uniref:VWFA domain-containing protein n=1 Tax=Botrimarina hoheduenensis TaxID=2528000 RepID=A0A5C5VYL0_9BACT|nr:hypothetical protein [Botrimarina hoheduenensis]TWT43237.1 hypothetical protein Pla111_21870 [Botrimarina hoheduenensis]
MELLRTMPFPLRTLSLAALLGGMAWLSLAPVATAAVPAVDQLLPNDSVGLLWLPNVPDFRQRWDKTQLGELAADERLDAFLEKLSQRLEEKVGGLEDKLGVTMKDFNDAASGQAAVAMLGVTSARPRAAVVALVDATGRDQQAKELLSRIDTRLMQRGSEKLSAAGAKITVYRVPPAEDAKDKTPRTVACFHEANCVVATDNQAVAEELATRLTKPAANLPSLSQNQAYSTTRKNARLAARGVTETVVWFIDPFGYDTAARSLEPVETLPDKKDRVTLMREQGFDAVKGVGGLIAMASDARRDFVHHTSIYAPPKPGGSGKATDRYDGALRMFELPNTAELSVEPWAPRVVASYKTIRLDLVNLFDNVGSLFSAFAGYDNAFETTMEYFENDPYGPKINLRNEIVAKLGDRVVVMTDYKKPITPESERYLMVFDARDAAAIEEPLRKWMTNDGAELKAVDGVPYWEIVPEEELNGPVEIDGLLPLDAELDTTPREERVFRRAAVCLHQNQLVVGSDVEFLKQALFGVTEAESLQGSIDLAATLNELKQIAPGPRCAWTFSRTDQTLGSVYELVRQGKMPESESFFGRFLNRVLTSDEQREVGAVRDQRIDGAELPPFAEVESYFGPSARSGKTEKDGWTISGVVLRRTGG